MLGNVCVIRPTLQRGGVTILNVRLLNIRTFPSRLNRSHFYSAAVESYVFLRGGKKNDRSVWLPRKKKGERKRKWRMCAFGSHYGRLRTIMENPDNARANRARRFHVIPFSVGSFRVRIYNRRCVLRPCMHTRALTYHGCTRAFRVSRTRASVTPMHPSLVIYRTRYRSLIAYCNMRSYP